MFESDKLAIGAMENTLIGRIDEILVEAGMKVFVLWGKAFPKRYLRFVSGMGTATFGCLTLDSSGFLLTLDEYCDGNRNLVFWNERAFKMVKPMADYIDLFWSCDLYEYPDIPDILYNPITRTVECGDKVIHL